MCLQTSSGTTKIVAAVFQRSASPPVRPKQTSKSAILPNWTKGHGGQRGSLPSSNIVHFCEKSRNREISNEVDFPITITITSTLLIIYWIVFHCFQEESPSVLTSDALSDDQPRGLASGFSWTKMMMALASLESRDKVDVFIKGTSQVRGRRHLGSRRRIIEDEIVFGPSS